MDAMLQQALIDLATEIFDGAQGTGTWIVDPGPGQGVFGTLAALSADQASFRIDPLRQSVAAHAAHLRFGLALANAYARGEQPSHDWESSWAVQEVSELEWQALQAALRAEYEQYLGHMRAGLPATDQVMLTGWLASVAHSAFHLGAIRQLRP